MRAVWAGWAGLEQPPRRLAFASGVCGNTTDHHGWAEAVFLGGGGGGEHDGGNGGIGGSSWDGGGAAAGGVLRPCRVHGGGAASAKLAAHVFRHGRHRSSRHAASRLP